MFQNRYKSIVCQEDEYLLQLIRYIHLNPLRAKIVQDIEELARYRWSGHRVLMGKQEMLGQEVEEVLALFSKKTYEARRCYREFIADGIAEGKREDLVGKARGKNNDVLDPRILGAPEFVENILEQGESRSLGGHRKTIAEIVDAIAAEHGIPIRAVSGGSRMKAAVRARSAICRAALDEGHPAAEVARWLGMSGYGVSMAAKRGDSEILAGNGFSST